MTKKTKLLRLQVLREGTTPLDTRFRLFLADGTEIPNVREITGGFEVAGVRTLTVELFDVDTVLITKEPDK